MAEAIGEGEEPLGQFANEASGSAALAEWVPGAVQDTEPVAIHLVFEPTGGDELALVAFAYEQGWQVACPQQGQKPGRRCRRPQAADLGLDAL